MMTHLSFEQIQNYERRCLSLDDLTTVNEHLFSCDECYQAFLAILQRRFPIEIDLYDLGDEKRRCLHTGEAAAELDDYRNAHGLPRSDVYRRQNRWIRQDLPPVLRPQPIDSSASRDGAAKPKAWLPFFSTLRSASSTGLRLAALLALTFGFFVVLWAVMHRGSPGRPHTDEAVVVETPPPAPPPHAAGVQPPAPPVNVHPPDGSRAARAPQKALTRGPHRIRSQTYEIEKSLLAGNLEMPPAIERLDRSPAEAIRGNRGSVESFSIVAPFRTVIEADRPTFRWTPLSGARSYEVYVYDADLNLVRTSGLVSATSWLIPVRLNRGAVYTWMVTALKDGKQVVAPALPARAEFQVVEVAERTKLDRSLNDVVSHAARGVLYAQAGLLDNALAEFRAHLTLHPADQNAKKLLSTLKSWRGGNN